MLKLILTILLSKNIKYLFLYIKFIIILFSLIIITSLRNMFFNIMISILKIFYLNNDYNKLMS